MSNRRRTRELSRTRIARLFALGALGAVLSCASPAVRVVAQLDPGVPVGRVEGGTFTGLRIPMSISDAGTGWKISTTYPEFLLEQGYEKAGLEQSQVFVYNPDTRSSIQIEFSPAGPRDTFTQEGLEWLASIMTGGMDQELDHEYGAGNYRVTHGKATPYPLNGVPLSAKNESRYVAKGETRENGWIYAFAEPFQIFILYQINDPEKNRDLTAVGEIISTFRYSGAPGSDAPPASR